jgi:hypothetical protein
MLEAILMQTKFFLHLHYVANKILEVSTSYCLGSNLADQQKHKILGRKHN